MHSYAFTCTKWVPASCWSFLAMTHCMSQQTHILHNHTAEGEAKHSKQPDNTTQMRPLVPAEQRRTVVDIQVVDLLLPRRRHPQRSCAHWLPVLMLHAPSPCPSRCCSLRFIPEITPFALSFGEFEDIIARWLHGGSKHGDGGLLNTVSFINTHMVQKGQYTLQLAQRQLLSTLVRRRWMLRPLLSLSTPWLLS